MSSTTQRFLTALEPGHRDESLHSVYHRAVNMTNAILVVDEAKDASPLLEACFDHRFPVAVDLVRHDPNVPRIESSSMRIVGEPEIRRFLEKR